MAFTRLVDSWHRDRRLRTRMPWGRRVASMEAELGADMTLGRHARWERLDLHSDQRAGEPEVDEQHETEQEEESAAGPDDHNETGEREPAPHPGAQAREFEAQLFPGTSGGATGQHQQIGDAANEIDHQQNPEATKPEQPEQLEPEPELEDDEVEP